MTQLPAVLDPRAGVRAYLDDPDWMFKTGIGGVLNAVCLLISGMFAQNIWFVPLSLAISAIVTGYLVRTAKVKQDNPTAALPEWNDWSDLIFGGLTWVAIQFGWGVIAAIPITIAVIMGSIGINMYSSNVAAVAAFMATMGLTVLFVWLGMHFLLSYLMLNFAAEEKLLAAFNLGKVMRNFIRTPKPMLTAWILAFQLQFFGVLIPALTLLGIFLVPSTLFAAQLLGITLMSQAWRASLDAEQYQRVEAK